jgi:adenosylmethionine-8-amino-7-oxononanoate aminotransferase
MPPHDELVAADKAHTWHPFTHMAEWCAPDHDPLMLVSGQGALLRDSLGREYIDGNSSIWTNLHGHRHPRLDAALQRQLGRVAHTSFLGFSNPPAAQLAKELVELWPPGTLTRVFFSDDGSTAVEVALKIAAQYWQQRGEPKRQKFVAFSGAYHGDTMGASSLGGIGAFHERFAAWQFPVVRAGSMDDLDGMEREGLAAVIIEPLIQGANQMRLWPAGMLRDLRAWCDQHRVLLILDEVMTGFGRTGTMFACEQEEVAPDLIALAKGLSGGYVPLAATLTTERIYEAFLGGPDKTLYYGHSYTGNQLACAVALENLAIFREERVLEGLQEKIALMRDLLEEELRPLPVVHEIRQCGFIAGIELREADGARFPAERRVGTQVCLAARAHGLLTRPILDTIVLLPPYCISEAQLRHAVAASRKGIEQVCG